MFVKMKTLRSGLWKYCRRFHSAEQHERVSLCLLIVYLSSELIYKVCKLPQTRFCHGKFTPSGSSSLHSIYVQCFPAVSLLQLLVIVLSQDKPTGDARLTGSRRQHNGSGITALFLHYLQSFNSVTHVFMTP